ncbi:MAG: hypothetical protein V2A79_14080 [Planctomycetota bacterium]
MMFTKLIIVVDEHVNVHDEHDVWFHVGANWDPRRDTMLIDGPRDILDHASPQYGSGAKMGIDATRKIPGEIEMTDDVKELVTQRWHEYDL